MGHARSLTRIGTPRTYHSDVGRGPRAKLYEQAAAELDQAAAHRVAAATHSEGPRCPGGAAAHAWAALGHLREPELRLEEQARTHHLKTRLWGLCRRSPPAGDRWHIRQPVPAARFTAVLPRGSSGDTGRARRHRQGDEDTAKGSVFGGSGDPGVVAGNRGARSGRWRCRSGTRSPTACDPSASLPGPLRHGRSGPGLSRTRHAHRPALPEPAAVVHRRSVNPSGILDGGPVVRSRSSRATASCWLASRAALLIHRRTARY
jgi:hypothetical protein